MNTKSPQERTADLEDRLEYICNALALTPDQRSNKHKVTEIDYVLDDIIRMDWIAAFPTLK